MIIQAVEVSDSQGNMIVSSPMTEFGPLLNGVPGQLAANIREYIQNNPGMRLPHVEEMQADGRTYRVTFY